MFSNLPAGYTERSYPEVRHLIRDADGLFWRTNTLRGAVTRAFTRGLYDHVGKAAWIYDRFGEGTCLMSVETVEGHGGIVIPLSKYVSEYPGQIDVYEAGVGVGADFSRERAADWIWRNVPGIKYGKRSLWQLFWTYFPVIRFFRRPLTDDQIGLTEAPVCSAVVAAADVAGGVDPVPNLATAYTTPGDLARSAFYKYRFTLVP